MTFPRYDEMADSGCPSLGLVPRHWRVERLKTVASCNDGVVDESTPATTEIEYVEISDVANGKITSSTVIAFGEAPSRARRIVRDGDVLVSTVRTYLRAIAPVIRPASSLVVSTGFAVVRPHSLTPEYARFALLAENFVSEVIARSVGVSYPAINASEVMTLRVPVPPVEEQRAIASFLIEETRKIDALVAEQEKLIALLEEKRQALISHSVTRGLEPSCDTKDSGSEWLGVLPTHWRVMPLMRLTDPMRPIMYGIVLPGPDVEEGVPILKGGNVRAHRMKLDSLARTTSELEAPYARARLRAGDLVYSIRGSIGDCEIVPPELEGANITQDVARVAPDAGVCGPWLRYVLLSTGVRKSLACGSLGAAVRGINIFDLKRARVPMPPPEEQSRIAAYLDRHVAAIDALVAECQRMEALALERRAALISAAVTGKIDVRGLVPSPLAEAHDEAYA